MIEVISCIIVCLYDIALAIFITYEINKLNKLEKELKELEEKLKNEN